MSESGETNTRFEFHCPHDGASVVWEITPERVNAVPLVEVTSVFCPVCYRDISKEVWQALNAPTFFVKQVLEHAGIGVGERAAYAGQPLTSPVAFSGFLSAWWAVRDILESAEYLTEEERAILQDRFGFQTGKVLSLGDLSRAYGRSPRSVLDVLHRVCETVMARSGPILCSFFRSPAGVEPAPISSSHRASAPPQFLTIAEAAEWTGLSRWRIYQAGRFDKVADAIADAPKGGWLVFACPLDRKPRTIRRKNSYHGTFFVTRDSLERYRDADRTTGPKGVNTKAWLEDLMQGSETG